MQFNNLLPTHEPAILALADGSVFQGISVGMSGETVGEVVFNTSITGYQEILTDPSYCEQIITLTYPHIGNVGVNPDDMESSRVHAAGLIIREISPVVSNWRATQSLPTFLEAHHVIAIANIDTRQLTRILREKGAQNGCIMTGHVDADAALKKAREFSGLNKKDLARIVSTKTSYTFPDTDTDTDTTTATLSRHIVIYDFGVKQNILRLLADRNCKITIVPAKTPAKDILKLNPDGIVLSNGPGDPAACDYAIESAKEYMTKKMPIFGICLGFQILALACGAKTQKMKCGHHGANHPVQDVRSNKVYITSQNHGFCVDIETLPDDLAVTHISLFDKTLQGFKHKTLPMMGFQGHPEAAPGPADIVCLFDQFIEMIDAETY